MLKKILIISSVLSLFLTGCSVGEINISRREDPTQPQFPPIIDDDTNVSNSGSSADDTNSSNQNSSANENVQLNNNHPEVPEAAKLGERFCVIAPANSGYLYLTLNKCEVYDNLNDAGIKYDELQHMTLIDGINYNSQTTELLDENKMIMLYMTIENVDAISVFHEDIPDHFGKYDFSVKSFGYVPGAGLEYLDDRLDDKMFYDIIHLEPSETKDFTVGFVLPTKHQSLEDAVFTNGDEHSLIPYTVVNLELGE